MKKKALCILAAVLFCLALPWPASANSMEPPELTVVVMDPPEDLELSLMVCREGQEGSIAADAYHIAWEGYYLFRPWNFPDFWDRKAQDITMELLVETGGGSFAIPLDAQSREENTGRYYNGLCVLDLQARTLTPDTPWWRQPVLVCLRVALTLLLEGLVFLLFGYRQRRSWLVFLAVNLVTQLGVNLAVLSLANPFFNLSEGAIALMFWFVYLPVELLVLVVEIVAFRLLLRERTKGRAAGAAFLANLLSWALGGLLLLILPI